MVYEDLPETSSPDYSYVSVPKITINSPDSYDVIEPEGGSGADNVREVKHVPLFLLIKS